MTQLITIQGSARGGKGTLTRALTDDLSRDYRVYKIDQGLKFRIIAHTALDAGVSIEDLDALAEFVSRDTTRQAIIDKLVEVATLDKAQLEAEYYAPRVSNAAGMVGKLTVSQNLAVDLLDDEVTAVAPQFDIIIVDGRTLRTKGKKLAERGIVEYLLAIDVHCDAFVSAQRETKIFAPQDDTELDSYSREQAIELLVATRDIARRNTSDARRATYPSLPLRGAYEFDVLHETSDAEWADILSTIREIGAVSVDNSATRSVEQLTTPVVRLVRGLLS